MEVREKFIARLLNDPEQHGFSEIRFIHTPQLATAAWVRLRCQYTCRHARQSDYCPPFSPTASETLHMLDEYKFGLIVRREEPLPFHPSHEDVWREFQQSLIDAENESFIRGYGKAFALAAGNCLFGHHDDAVRPCEFSGKSRPTLEALGINLHDTLNMIGWEQHLLRDPDDPFQMFGLLLLE